MNGFNVNCGDCRHCAQILDGVDSYFVCCKTEIVRINGGWPHVDIEKNIDCNFFEEIYKPPTIDE